MSFELNPITREFFSVIYNQSFSPDYNFISVCNNFGEVVALPVYESSDPVPPRRLKFDANVYSLLTLKNSNLLICGSENGLLQGFDWIQLTTKTNGDFESKFSFTVSQREINSVCSINDEKYFVAGYGDGHLSLHAVDRPDKVLIEFNGHTDQVNQVIEYKQNQFVSCSSDGTVNLYDISTGSEPVKRLNVLKNTSILRPGHCRAVLAVAVHDQFVICGGGVDLAKYDLSSGSLLQLFDQPKHGSHHYNIHCIDVSKDKIGIGTSHGSILGYSHSGHHINEIPVAYGPVLNLNSFIDSKYQYQMTAASGLGSKISMISTVKRTGLGPEEIALGDVAKFGLDALSPPFAATSSGYVPDDPFFKEDIFGIESPPLGRMPEELRDDLSYGNERKILETPPEPGIKTILPGDILSPLNDLRASPEQDEDEKFKMIKELEKLNLNEDGHGYDEGARARDFVAESEGMGGGGIQIMFKHSHSNPYADEVVRSKKIEEDGELCEHCLLEERRRSAVQTESMLKEKLDRHIHEMNEMRMRNHRRRPELLPMGVLPPFMNRDDDAVRIHRDHQKAAYRMELEEEMTRKRLAAELEKAREKQMSNYANTEDAREYARARDEQVRFDEAEKVRNRDILEKQMELKKLTRKESEDRLEWWERKALPGQKPIERDAEFLSDQLRRNEALKRSIEQLEKFKEVQQHDDQARRAADKLHFSELREKVIDEQSALIRDRDFLDRPRQYVFAPNPVVFKAWEEAHLNNDKRYRVLQDIEHQKRRQRQIEEESKSIRCRRCHRLIRRELKRRVLNDLHP
ncbi:hypothetical protein FO519_001352 [Halicephalobus sp. NKZ332]|nr:hypothetical protein FO519_001352 [Halicephalobus sp. NKZ332]